MIGLRRPARPHPALVEIAANRPVDGGYGPAGLVASAREHRMTGLLWTQVRAGAVTLSSDDDRQLTELHLLARRTQQRLATALPAILARFGDAGAAVAVVKGLPTEWRWYDRAGERPCRDIDLWLDPAALARIGEVMAAVAPSHPLAGSAQVLYERGMLPSVDLVIAGVAVDLHFDLLKNIPPRPWPALWQRVVPLTAPDGEQVPVLDAEASLVHFLMHLNCDSMCWLLGMADVARVVQRSGLDWKATERLARDHGLEAPAWGTLERVTKALGLAVPGRPQLRPGPRAVGWRTVWRPGVILEGDAGWLAHRHRGMWMSLFSRRPAGEVLRWWWAQVRPAGEIVALANPATAGPGPWRLWSGRARRLIQRRRALGQLRRGAGGDRRPGGGRGHPCG